MEDTNKDENVVAVETSVQEDAQAQPDAQMDLKKKELIDTVAERANIRRGGARVAIEAALEVLGEALEEGRSLNLLPLGKMKVNQIRVNAAGEKIIVAKLRKPAKKAETSEDTSAEAESQDTGPEAELESAASE